VSLARVLGPVLVAVLLAVPACKTSPESSSEGASASAGPSKPSNAPIRFLPAPQGDVPAIVQAEMARSRAAGGRLVVYEGATWCEPCKHFHEAVAKGELDATFPGVTLLEFDLDRDRDRLVAAGYDSQYIPLFALPSASGRAAGPKASGGIKGDGVIPYLTKKLQDLLAQGS